MLEIFLVVLGLVIFTCSFFLPAGKRQSGGRQEQVSEDAVREMVEKEVEEAKGKISDIVDEIITYAMEKTERAMDRLTNEKMMAVNDYSDTVLEQINKNHKEAVFLYDMLNDKHENLKSTVSEAVKTASEVQKTVKDAEVTAKEASQKAKEVKEIIEEPKFTPFDLKEAETVMLPFTAQEQQGMEPKMETPSARKPGRKPKKAIDGERSSKETEKAKSAGKGRTDDKETALPEEVPEVTVSLNGPGKSSGRNSNERILELHKAGKSNMAIARELGLGIGEVKLVIDLFEGV